MVTAAGYAPTRVGRANKYCVAFSPSGEQAVFVKRPDRDWEEASSAFQDVLLFFGIKDLRERVRIGGGAWVSYA